MMYMGSNSIKFHFNVYFDEGWANIFNSSKNIVFEFLKIHQFCLVKLNHCRITKHIHKTKPLLVVF